jgi:Flp pilus assembly protein TadD
MSRKRPAPAPAATTTSPAVAPQDLGRRWLWSLFALALLVRLAVLLQLSDSWITRVVVGDGRFYDGWARRIAGGDVVGSDAFFLAPFYAYFLGAVYALFGPDWLLVRCLHVLAGALTVVLLADATARLFDRRTGRVAGVLCALYAPLVWLEATVQKTALEVFLAAAFLALLARLAQRRSTARLLGAGLVLGVLTLTRENALILLPIAAAWLVLDGRAGPRAARWRHAGVLALGFVLVLVPVLARNRAVTSDWALTYNLGSNFWIGNHAGADGLYDNLQPGHGSVAVEAEDVVRLAQADLGRPLRPSEASAWWLKRGLADVRADPGRFVALLAHKTRLTWNAEEQMDNEAYAAYTDESSVLRLLGHVLHFGVLAPLAMLGLLLALRRWRELWFLPAVLLALTVGVALFYVFARYRITMALYLMPFAALGGCWLWEACRARRWSAGAAGVLLSLAAAVWVNWPVHTSTGDPRAATYASYGEALLSGGQTEEALSLLRRALAYVPNDAVMHNNLAIALKQSGNLPGAIAEYREAVRLRPEYADAWFNLSTTFWKQGDADAALDACREALRLDPDFALAHTHHGVLLYRRGELPEAIAAWRAALRVNPEDTTALSNLAGALLQTGDTAGAIATYEQVLRLDPGHAAAKAMLAKLRPEGTAPRGP